MEEIWKDIEGYEDLYQISNLGRVKSLNYRHTGKEQILKPYKNKQGYLRVSLNKNNQKKKYSIHRLVAQAFIDNSSDYPCINHIDECKTNNNVNNLEWCNCKYNANYGTRIKRISDKNKKSIYCLETNKYYNSIIECANELNISRRHISDVLKGRLKQTGKLTFRYANQILFIGVE